MVFGPFCCVLRSICTQLYACTRRLSRTFFDRGRPARYAVVMLLRNIQRFIELAEAFMAPRRPVLHPCMMELLEPDTAYLGIAEIWRSLADGGMGASEEFADA